MTMTVWIDLPAALRAALIEQGYLEEDLVSIGEPDGDGRRLLKFRKYTMILRGRACRAMVSGSGAPDIDPVESDYDLGARLAVDPGTGAESLARIDLAKATLGTDWQGGDSAGATRALWHAVADTQGIP